MWPLKIGWEALTGIFGSVGRFLSLAGILAAVAGGIFLYGVQCGKSDARVAQLEAEIAAVRDRARREAALARRLEREKNDLENALREIDEESPLTGDGADVRLGSNFLCQLQRTYNPDIGCDPAIPGRRE